MLQGDAQDKREKMARLNGRRQPIWMHPLFLGAIALLLVAYISTYW